MGWLASVIARERDVSRTLFVYIVVGLIGALIGGWLISPLVGARTIDDGALNVPSLIGSLAGAVGLLAMARISRRRRFPDGETAKRLVDGNRAQPRR